MKSDPKYQRTEKWDKIHQIALQYYSIMLESGLGTKISDRTDLQRNIVDEVITLTKDSFNFFAKEFLYGKYDRQRKVFTRRPIRIGSMYVVPMNIGYREKELAQYGMVKVFKSFHNFDPNKGSISTWLRRTALLGIYNEVRSSVGSILHVPADLFEYFVKISRDKGGKDDIISRISALKASYDNWGRYEKAVLLYVALTGDYEEISVLLYKDQFNDETLQFSVPDADNIGPLDGNLQFNGDVGDEVDFIDGKLDVICQEEPIFSSPFDLLLSAEGEEIYHLLLSTLNPRDERVLDLRFGKKDMTLEEVGELYDVTRERIRQIEEKALIKLGHPSRRELVNRLKDG